MRYTPLPVRALDDAKADLARREHARAIEELRRALATLELTGGSGTPGPAGPSGPAGPAGPAPSGTGYVHVTGGTLDSAYLTIPGADVDLFTDVAPGVVPASGGGTLKYLRADQTWQPIIGGLELFGFGYDGAANADGVGAIPGATLAGSTYTLTRAVSYSSLAIANGVIIVTAGHMLMCSGAVTGTGTAIIQNNGSAGAAGTTTTGTAGTGAAGAFYQAGGNGSNGTGGVSAGAAAIVVSATPRGGASAVSNAGLVSASGGPGDVNHRGGGGGGGSNSGGPGGTVSIASATTILTVAPISILLGGAFGSSTGRIGASTGGGGGGGVAGSFGGGGGGGGGWCVVCARSITNVTIQANGGNGGNGHVTSGGGGGGGGGGHAVLFYGTRSGVTVQAAGGAGGTGAVGRGSGGAGAAGFTWEMNISGDGT